MSSATHTAVFTGPDSNAVSHSHAADAATDLPPVESEHGASEPASAPYVRPPEHDEYDVQAYTSQFRKLFLRSIGPGAMLQEIASLAQIAGAKGGETFAAAGHGVRIKGNILMDIRNAISKGPSMPLP